MMAQTLNNLFQSPIALTFHGNFPASDRSGSANSHSSVIEGIKFNWPHAISSYFQSVFGITELGMEIKFDIVNCYYSGLVTLEPT